MNRRIFTLLTLLSLALLIPVLSFGQAISGDLTGVVKDSSGAYVANADVEITNLATGFKQTTKQTPRASIISSTCLLATTQWTP